MGQPRPGRRIPGEPGLSTLGAIALAALAVPRVVAHDLSWVSSGSLANVLLVFVPLVIWLAALLVVRVDRPLVAGATIGLAYGVMLAVAHQILWNRAFEDDPPELGGNLEGELPGVVEDVVLRGFGVMSSLATGLLVGAVVGGLAWLIDRARSNRRPVSD